MNAPVQSPRLAQNVSRLSRMDLPGSGQIYVDGKYAYFGHITNKEGYGTSIVDVSDPRKPQLVSQLKLDDPSSHSHKVRVIGDIMIVNSERNGTAIGRKAAELPKAQADLRKALGRDPTHSELAAKLDVKESDIVALEEEARTPYRNGGFKIYDVSDRSKPKLISFTRTHGIGVHRFDMDESYAYISTEAEGFIGNILVIYDIRKPEKPEEVAKWWIPGQHVAGGEKPTWPGRQHRLHHAMRCGDRLYAGCWHGGVRIVDISDVRKPKTIGAYNYHPPFPEPSHTFLEVPGTIDGRKIAVAIDEEDHAHSAEEVAKRRGRPHAAMWTFDITDPAKIQPLAIFEVSEVESPWARATPGRFGAHQFQEHFKGGDTLMYCAWFAGGLRIVDIADPTAPQEVGCFVPEPAPGKAAPQSNDVDVDDNGLIYLADRYAGFDILEYKGNR